MNLLSKYVKLHKKDILMFQLFGAIFLVVFYLGGANLYLILYAYLLCLFVEIVISGIQFYAFYQKQKLLNSLIPNMNLCVEELPKADNEIERLYQEIILQMNKEQMELVSNTEISNRDMMNYYTLWVHQIKTPIAALRLLLQSEPSEHKIVLENELFKIEQYVEMVLSYLRLGSDTTDYKIQRYSLDDIVKQALRKYARLFIQKKLSLKYESMDEQVLTDEKWLLFVIEQILSNSLKYTKSGTISIYMEDNQVLVIEDTGIGIALEDVPRVFEKGFTGYNGREDKKSTGLGLYLCKCIMNRLGHEIQLESKAGKGTKVSLCLAKEKMTFE